MASTRDTEKGASATERQSGRRSQQDEQTLTDAENNEQEERIRQLERQISSLQSANESQSEQPGGFNGEALLARVHGYVQKGLPYQDNDEYLEVNISVNKDVWIEMTRRDTNRRETIMIAKDREQRVSMQNLQEIVRRVIQEGPVGLNYEWGAKGVNRFDIDKGLPGNERDKDLPALEVKVHGVEVGLSSPDAYKLRVPIPPR